MQEGKSLIGKAAAPHKTALYWHRESEDPQKTFDLEVFGCQMNVHDSEKVVGTLLAEGYQQVQTVEEAGLILYNTCSIRDKAEQKVFHRLADYKKLQKQGKRFGVLGGVAQQEGEKNFDRRPTSRWCAGRRRTGVAGDAGATRGREAAHHPSRPPRDR